MSFIRYNRRDWLCTAAITLIALILAVCGLQKGLAKRATAVVRMVCGIPTPLKGELPSKGE